MYVELLKELYYNERKKLEEMLVSQQESRLKILKIKKTALERVRSRLSTNEINGREDIAEEVKDNLLRGGENEEKMQEQIDKRLDLELTDLENEEKIELKNANYTPEEFADYLFQAEKVSFLEDALSEARVFPEEAYREQKELNEKPQSSS